MKRLLGLLLVLGIVGCGLSETEGANAFQKLQADIGWSNQGEVLQINTLTNPNQITDTGQAHRNGLTSLGTLGLGNTHRVRRIRWVARQSDCGPFQTNRLDDRQPDERRRRSPLPYLRRIATTRFHHVRSRRRDMFRRRKRVS